MTSHEERAREWLDSEPHYVEEAAKSLAAEFAAVEAEAKEKHGSQAVPAPEAPSGETVASVGEEPGAASDSFRPNWSSTLPEAALAERLEQCESMLFWLQQGDRIPGNFRHRIRRFFKGSTPSIVAAMDHKEKEAQRRVAVLEAALKDAVDAGIWMSGAPMLPDAPAWPEMRDKLHRALGALSGEPTALPKILERAVRAGFRSHENGEGWDGYEDAADIAKRVWEGR